MFINSNIGKHATIIDTNTLSIIASGIILYEKHTIDGKIFINLISFDGKYFFKREGNSKYLIKFDNKCPEKKFIPSNFKYLCISHWSNAINNYNDISVDIYEENTYFELDPEVADICKQLNLINGITTIGSCSGHNERSAWINIQITSISGLNILLKILSLDSFRHSFILTSDATLLHSAECQFPMLKLKTIDIGDAAFRNINKLVEFLKIYL